MDFSLADGKELNLTFPSSLVLFYKKEQALNTILSLSNGFNSPQRKMPFLELPISQPTARSDVLFPKISFPHNPPLPNFSLFYPTQSRSLHIPISIYTIHTPIPLPIPFPIMHAQ